LCPTNTHTHTPKNHTAFYQQEETAAGITFFKIAERPQRGIFAGEP